MRSGVLSRRGRGWTSDIFFSLSFFCSLMVIRVSIGALGFDLGLVTMHIGEDQGDVLGSITYFSNRPATCLRASLFVTSSNGMDVGILV